MLLHLASGSLSLYEQSANDNTVSCHLQPASWPQLTLERVLVQTLPALPPECIFSHA